MTDFIETFKAGFTVTEGDLLRWTIGWFIPLVLYMLVVRWRIKRKQLKSWDETLVLVGFLPGFNFVMMLVHLIGVHRVAKWSGI